MNPNVFLFNNKLIDYDYDVIVIGGGHAGVEAAYAASNLGSKTLLLTLNIDRIALMPCNPAIGGIGKGHIVFELSAFNGLMPKVVTKTYLQARMLNTKKGPAVQGLRVQIDKTAYSKEVIKELRQTKNLTIVMAMVEEFLVSDNKIYGIKTREGEVYYSKSVILTSGTFLQGLIHVGHTNYNGGRQGDEACNSLSLQLLKLGFNLKRLKTGTPARILGSSINFSLMVEQPSDDLNYLFEFSPHKVVGKLSCYITSTNENTHNIIKNNFDKSPIFTGYIKGTPPRYCPSIEDKISRFSLKNSHNVFVEPENETAQEYYPNGLSTSLPFDVQKKFIKSIKGFEDAILTRPGYAIEYDAIYSQDLKHTLESKNIENLFFAGQINGTTGYEEAAGQGLVAGINAHLKAFNKESFVLSRTESYIGIMVDDLVTLGVDEPYRMFTSRAERRLLLRQDNTFDRLADKAYNLGLLNSSIYDLVLKERKEVNDSIFKLKNSKNIVILRQLFAKGDMNEICNIIKNESSCSSDRVLNMVYANLLYEPYIKREENEVLKTKYYQSLEIPKSLDLTHVSGLSIELRQKIAKYKPSNIAQASIIQGMTPAAISLLIFKVREFLKDKNNNIKFN